jgi:hypothetical protein
VFCLHFLCFGIFFSLLMVYFGFLVVVYGILFNIFLLKHIIIHCMSLICFEDTIFVCKCLHHDF